ncbi:SDR family NAD(P)-dependent oxidoreductase [Lysinibacillus odysseyi]|uniref:Oxidoreductase n=1 Tax=Lysinibacillus odysseyi 34hs-1 = NBRC 100172 TaxID=1220589 RepID=A0A0A3IJY4_9BACI|nr:SDR family NAD(P)-dependent oxidoreductase [Lysinibacillus odysseyi]KGR85071.1 oxidoreductase [Lysinibacillus odysseyi 34hs-1 = NBRC 100172]
MNKKTVFVTGATSGVGLKITEICIKKGYTVYATGRNESALKTLSNMGAHVIQADLRRLEDMERVVSELPDIDVAILNAGLGIFANVHELTDEEVDTMIDVNVKAPIYLTKRIAPKLIARGGGHLIYVSSQAGKVATRKASVYAASKHAITGFLNGVRLELAEYGINVTGIFPGPIDTPFLQKADATNAYRESIKRFLIEPEYVATEVVKTIERPVREVNLPRVMGITAKLYALAPVLVEKVGKGFFNKK